MTCIRTKGTWMANSSKCPGEKMSWSVKEDNRNNNWLTQQSKLITRFRGLAAFRTHRFLPPRGNLCGFNSIRSCSHNSIFTISQKITLSRSFSWYWSRMFLTNTVSSGEAAVASVYVVVLFVSSCCCYARIFSNDSKKSGRFKFKLFERRWSASSRS